MQNSNSEKSIRNIISSMKLSQLRALTKFFELNISNKKKGDFIKNISFYIENNIELIINNIITYEEYEFIKEICDNNYNISLNRKGNVKQDIKNSLEYIGLIYTYDDCEDKKVSIPIDIREVITLRMSEIEFINHSKENQKYIDLFKNLLDIYGVIPHDLLLDYIIQDIGTEYRVHEIIQILWRYNTRYNLCYIDFNLNYYNNKIIDISSLNQKLLEKQELKYKYYDKIYFKNVNDRNLHNIEKELQVVLKRHFKNSEIILEYMEYIRTRIKNDVSSREISESIMNKTKRMSEQGRRIIEGLVDMARIYYPLWNLKGHSLKDLKYSMDSYDLDNKKKYKKVKHI